MSRRVFPRPCRWPGCPEIVTTGFCDKHRGPATAARNERRRTTAERGYGGRHRRWRQRVLARDPLCVDPFGVHARRDELVEATVADHVVPLSQGGGWSLENGQGLCASCHARKTNEERAQRARRGR